MNIETTNFISNQTIIDEITIESAASDTNTKFIIGHSLVKLVDFQGFYVCYCKIFHSKCMKNT